MGGSVRYGEHDPNRAIVCLGWDGRSKPFHGYRDEIGTPMWQRTIIVGVPSETK